jgi:hypothetical protein
MPALVAGIHAFLGGAGGEDVDGRNKSGHDGCMWLLQFTNHKTDGTYIGGTS